jgi:pimeloyl-ACP methyl ester carboxylesterase
MSSLLVLGAALSFPIAFAATPSAAATSPRKSIVLVHGEFVDGSGWQAVYHILKKDGYDVSIVQIPTESLARDVAATHRVIALRDKPVVLVGHSYGGVVITEAGNDPKVAALVYIAGFAPEAGESVASLISKPAPGATAPTIVEQNGALVVDEAQFHASFAADVDPLTAAFMAASQPPWGLEAMNGTVSAPAWKEKRSWYLVTAQDRMIPPDAQRMMAKRAGATVLEGPGSHAVHVSRPEMVASVIRAAAQQASTACNG